MDGRDLLRTLDDPAVRRGVQQALGLPSEPVAEALRELGERVTKLAEAQARTDASVRELAQAQARTDLALAALADEVGALARAQARTEEALGALRREVGALSDNVGFGLEELAAIVLPGVLASEERVRVAGPFRRRFLLTASGEEEVDLYGDGERDGEPVVVVGEVKARIYEAEVKRFAAKMGRLAAGLPAKPVPVLFGFVVHPSAHRAAAELGVRVVASRPG